MLESLSRQTSLRSATTAALDVDKKSKRAGVGSHKSGNFLEKKKADKRRQAKADAIKSNAAVKEEQEWLQGQNAKYAIVDKHDVRNQNKIQVRKDKSMVVEEKKTRKMND